MSGDVAPPRSPGVQPLADPPGATASLVLGILSLVLSAPVLGLVLAFVGLVKARDARRTAEMNPGVYRDSGVAQAGFVCSIIGLVLGGMSTLCTCGYLVFVLVALGAAASGA